MIHLTQIIDTFRIYNIRGMMSQLLINTEKSSFEFYAAIDKYIKNTHEIKITGFLNKLLS